jgi:NAD(P) transhydrogenase subunit alpha
MYSRNLFNFLKPALPKGGLAIDWSDEVFAGAVLTHEGQIKHEATRAAVEGQKT